jgi:hypothetical protein
MNLTEGGLLQADDTGRVEVVDPGRRNLEGVAVEVCGHTEVLVVRSISERSNTSPLSDALPDR